MKRYVLFLALGTCLALAGDSRLQGQSGDRDDDDACG